MVTELSTPPPTQQIQSQNSTFATKPVKWWPIKVLSIVSAVLTSLTTPWNHTTILRQRHFKLLFYCNMKLKQEAQLMLTNPRDAFLSQMVPFGFEKCCNLETGIRGHSSYHSVALIWFLLVSYMSVLTLSLRRTIFLDICLQKLQWPWNRGLGSPKVIKNGTICQIVYDLLLMFYSNKRLYLVSSRRDNIVKTQFSHTPPPIQCTVT